MIEKSQQFNSGQTGTNDKDAGFIVERGDDTNVGLVWDESADEFAVVSTTETGTTSGNITISAYANIRATAFYGDGSNLTNIPDRECDCSDEKEHSPTRGVFLLTDDEANALKNDERVKFVCIDYASYPELYAPPPDEIAATAPELIERYSGTIKNYREFHLRYL